MIAVIFLLCAQESVPIETGRQLFVDDHLIESTTLRRTYYRGTVHPTPMLRPDRAWEQRHKDTAGSYAMVYSDGVWFDPQDKLFKMFYMADPKGATCLATSKDGLAWEKPEFDVVPGTNIVLTEKRDSCTVWLDLEERDPSRRWKLFRAASGKGSEGWALWMHVSPDGIHWSGGVGRSGWSGDRSTVFRNPFRQAWVFSLRDGWSERPRRRRYFETKEIIQDFTWKRNEPPMWCEADAQDPMRDDLQIPAQLYNLDCAAYESLLLGAFTIWRGQPAHRHKPNDLVLGYSRDGLAWSRPDRRPFATGTDRIGDWNYANIQSAGGVCLVVHDQLYFYVSGRAGSVPPEGTPPPQGDARPNPWNRDGDCSTGLVTLRRDGFASMDGGGILLTKPLQFSGSHLFVNLDGELLVEAIDEKGSVSAASTRVRGDSTCHRVPLDLSRCTRLRFHQKSGRLFSFWITPDPKGASRGYVAAGGPGFKSLRDDP